MKKLIYISMLAAVLLAACGPQATPTMNPADVQATAFSAASTMVAQTQAAIPTATPLPPTETPTNTPPPTNTVAAPTLANVGLPTLAPTQPSSGGGADNCLHPLNMGEAGPTHPIVISNESGGALNLSLNLYQPNLFGQCGAISYANVAKGATLKVDLPQGYWFAYAWITLKSGSSESSGSFYIQNGMDDKQRLIIRTDTIVLKP
jgi:hypothetical protein